MKRTVQINLLSQKLINDVENYMYKHYSFIPFPKIENGFTNKGSFPKGTPFTMNLINFKHLDYNITFIITAVFEDQKTPEYVYAAIHFDPTEKAQQEIIKFEDYVRKRESLVERINNHCGVKNVYFDKENWFRKKCFDP